MTLNFVPDKHATEFILDELDHIMPLAEFIACCKYGGFVDDDGSGYYATATHKSLTGARPSEILKGNIDSNYTHVIWYNR